MVALDTRILLASSSCDKPAFTRTADNLIFNWFAIFSFTSFVHTLVCKMYVTLLFVNCQDIL
nr:MAG TPA: hypothetical protein [Caudoviricetes sp.]